MPRAVNFLESLGFRVSEDIQDDDGTVYAAWMHRKQTVHDTALTGGNGPRMHHVAFATHEKHNIIPICDKMGALRISDAIERGPGRHGVSNAFYLYLRDPDGHRVEIYTQDYYTGDPDNPIITWDVHDNQRRDWWGNPVVPSWYTEASLVLDLDGNPQPVVARTDTSEMAVTIGADGFSYTRPDDAPDELPELEAGRVQARPPAVTAQLLSWTQRDSKTARRHWTDAGCRDDRGDRRRSSPRPTASHSVIPRITARYPEATIEDSYAIQGVWRDQNIAAGRRLVGRKIGLTSKAMQEATGITEPDYGVMFDDIVYRSGAEIPVDRYTNLRIEVELAFVLKEPLEGPDCTIFDALRATDYVVPALEILNSHIEMEGRTIVDTISDNAAMGAMVVGDVRKRPDEIDLRWVPGAPLQEPDRGDRRRRRRPGPPRATASPGSRTSSPPTATA